MAHFQRIPKAALRSIARELSPHIHRRARRSRARNGAVFSDFEIAETFPVWFLGKDAVSHRHRDLARLATDTGYWHHQIREGGKPLHAAHSAPVGSDRKQWRVLAVSGAHLARKIDRAIRWIDRQSVGDPLVRLLLVPSYHSIAFWLQYGDSDRILVVEIPPSFGELRPRRLYSSHDFLEKLAGEAAPLDMEAREGDKIRLA